MLTMEKSPLELFHEIKQILFANNASNFAVLFFDSIYEKIKNREIVTIFAPSDSALDRLSKATTKSVEDIAKLPAGRVIFTNHLSSSQLNMRGFPTYTAVNGTKFGTSIQDLDRLEFKSYDKIDYITIRVMDRIIHQGRQIEDLYFSQITPSTK